MESITSDVAEYIITGKKNFYMRELCRVFKVSTFEMSTILTTLVKDGLIFASKTHDKFWSSFDHKFQRTKECNLRQKLKKQALKESNRLAKEAIASRPAKPFKELGPTPKWLLERLAESGYKGYIGVFDDPDRLRAGIVAERKSRR